MLKIHKLLIYVKLYFVYWDKIMRYITLLWRLLSPYRRSLSLFLRSPSSLALLDSYIIVQFHSQEVVNIQKEHWLVKQAFNRKIPKASKLPVYHLLFPGFSLFLCFLKGILFNLKFQSIIGKLVRHYLGAKWLSNCLATAHLSIRKYLVYYLFCILWVITNQNVVKNWTSLYLQ